MIRALLLASACSSVAAAPKIEVERDSNDPDRRCTMRGRCPADDLPRFDAALSVAGWARLQAATQTMAVRIEKDRVELDCVLPGSYVEVARAAASPGRAWASTRLVYTPDELERCEQATHLVAAFAVKDGAKRGTAIALPLPCGDGACLGVPERDRKAAAQARWDRAKPSMHGGEPGKALRDLTEMTALLPTPSSYRALASALSFMTSTEYGGCLWLSEAEMAANPSGKRLAPQHDVHDCRTQPSFVTCFPDQFVPGEGGNCW